MWKQKKATNLLTRNILAFVLIAFLLGTTRALSDKRLCADENCKEIISMGFGLINYRSGEEGMVSFKINSAIRIKSKSAGNNKALWGIEVNGREGYAPKEFIRETKKLISDSSLKYLVDVKPPNAVPILTTSEKMVEQENTVEKTTTKPLNLKPEEPTQSTFKRSSDIKLSAEISPVATPVITEIVDDTKVSDFMDDSVESDNEETLNELEAELHTAYEDVDSDDEDQQAENSIEQKVTVVNNDDFLKTSEDIKARVMKDVNDTTHHVNKNDVKNETHFVSSETSTINEEQNHEILRETMKSDENMNDAQKDMGNEQTKEEGLNAVALQKPGETSFVSSRNSTIDEQNQEILRETKKSDENINDVEKDLGNEQAKEERLNAVFLEKSGVGAKNEILSNSQSISNEKQITENEEKVNTTENVEKKDSQIGVQNSEHLAEVGQYPKDLSSENSHQISTKVEENTNLYGTLDINTTEPLTDLGIKNNETSTTKETIDQQKAHTEVETDKQMYIDNINSSPGETDISNFDNKNFLRGPADADKQLKTSDNKLLQNSKLTLNTNPKIPKEVVNVEEIAKSPKHITGTEINSNEISSGSLQQNSNVIEDKITKNDNQASDNTDIGVKEMEQITTSNSTDNSNADNFNTNNFQKESADSPHNRKKETPNTEFRTILKSEEEEVKTPPIQTEEVASNTTPKIPEEMPTQEEIAIENITPTTYSLNSDAPLTTPLPIEYDYSYQELSTTNISPNDNYFQQSESLQENLHSLDGQTTGSYKSAPTVASDTVEQPLQKKDEHPKATISSFNSFDNYETKENKGLFATIMGTVNNMLSINKKNKQNEHNGDHEFDGTFSSKNDNEYKIEKLNEGKILEYCKNIGPTGDCPETEQHYEPSTAHFHHEPTESIPSSDLTLDTFLHLLASQILEISELLAFLFIVASACLFFIFGYYCFCNSSREGALLSKLNQLESSLLATHKENAILKHNLMATRQKLVSIEDNSFGSNDMVVSLRKELEEELMEKSRLQEQITVLQKELENAADAGIELNKIVSELLSNQTGDESIISSVEELQKQLNEQQNTILEINASLAEKSRENSELQLLIAEQNARYEAELANVQRDNDELEHEKGNLLTRLEEVKSDFDKDITAALEGKNLEIKRLQNEIVILTNKMENEHTKWQTSVAKVEALEECLKHVRKDPHVNITEVIDVANVKAQLIETQKKYNSLRERLETELDSRKLAENQLELVSADVEKLKQDFNQSEKDKLEAQTRLEVLSNYFKDKENQLQKELSLKEAMWLKQQGETTTTVDRVTAMQEEIQSLKSQNDSLRAEIEAQVAAHKAQTGTLENRAHETWLAARQSDRRYEEARAEATALRRKLTVLAGGAVNEVNKPTAGPSSLGDELTQAPSPILMESPGSPMLGRLPPPPFLPPPFMGHPPPFMGMPPPPPFVPPGEMRPAPLGRIMSPPPQRSSRFSPQHLDYEDYLDYEGNNTWHRHTYSPPPRTYRSLSPTDSRYNYGTERELMSTYDTETDFSPPPSPRESRRRGGDSSERIDSNSKISYGNTKKFNTSNKGLLSSGSEKSFNTPSHSDNKAKKGNASHGGKTLV